MCARRIGSVGLRQNENRKRSSRVKGRRRTNAQPGSDPINAAETTRNSPSYEIGQENNERAKIRRLRLLHTGAELSAPVTIVQLPRFKLNRSRNNFLHASHINLQKGMTRHSPAKSRVTFCKN
jgi:hypothetical protein